MYIENIGKLKKGLELVLNVLKGIVNLNDLEEYQWIRPFESIFTSLPYYDVPEDIMDELSLIAKIKDDSNKYYIKAMFIKPHCKLVYDKVTKLLEQVTNQEYKNLVLDGQYYKVKTVLHSIEKEEKSSNEDKVIRLIVASFYSYAEHDVFLTNLQKGYRSIKLSDSYGRENNLVAIKNGYISKQARSRKLNEADGVHAIIYSIDDNMLMARNEDNPVDVIYKWIDTKFDVPLLNIPVNADGTINEDILSRMVSSSSTNREGYIREVSKWKEYFYNKLSDKGFIGKCEGFDLTGKAPTIFILSNKIDEKLIWELAQNGIKEGHIAIPVKENVPLSEDISLTDFIMDRVLPYVNANEDLHYSVGDEISPVFNTPIVFEESGEKTELFPRQKIIVQGFLNYFKYVNKHKNYDKSAFFNGGMGVGKTLTTIKLAFATIKEIYGREHGRVLVLSPGHLTLKWQRQFREALNPIGINPIFYVINSFEDVKNIPISPQGFEVILMPKDRAKRTYQKGFTSIERWNSKSHADIYSCVNTIVDAILDKIEKKKKENEDFKHVVIEKVENIPLTALKLTAYRIQKAVKAPVFLIKERLDDKGKVKEYLVATTSKLYQAQGFTTKPYHFVINKGNYKEFVSQIKGNIDSLYDEYKSTPMRFRRYTQNGYICPSCGGLVYRSQEHQFDIDKVDENIKIKPNDRTSWNKACNSFIKADGTPLFYFERKQILNDRLDFEVTDKKVPSPYVNSDGEYITGEELIKVKANRYTGYYKVLLKKCNSQLWGAIDQKGYRCVNSADLMLRRLGKKSIDFGIYDELHLFAKESEQGNTFGKLCTLSKYNIGLTGTMSGGKSSELFYILWRMLPKTMVALGYKYNEVNRFVDHYGRRKRVTKESQIDVYNKGGQGRKSSSGWNETAGISPLMYNNFFGGTMISRTLNDMNIPMPELKYYKHEIEMDEELKNAYDGLKKQFLEFIKDNKGIGLGGSYLHTLLSYPDYPNCKDIFIKGTNLLVASPRKLDLDKLYPKEVMLLKTLEKELKENRRVLVYSVYSGEKGVSKRLMDIISQAGYKVAELRGSGKGKVNLPKREAWIQKKYDEGISVIVTNPSNLDTGLDILGYQTIYYYGMGYNVKTVRQASMRPYRPNQKKEVRIYHPYYKDSLQQDCIKLVGMKKKASLSLEGIFSDDLLSTLSDTEDDGSKILYKALKGQIKLKENELDVFNFQTDNLNDDDTECDINANNNVIDITDKVVSKESEQEPTEKANNEPSDSEITLFSITEEDMKMLKAKRRNKVSVGQFSFFSIG